MYHELCLNVCCVQASPAVCAAVEETWRNAGLHFAGKARVDLASFPSAALDVH